MYERDRIDRTHRQLRLQSCNLCDPLGGTIEHLRVESLGVHLQIHSRRRYTIDALVEECSNLDFLDRLAPFTDPTLIVRDEQPRFRAVQGEP